MSPLDDFPDEMSGYFVGEGTTDALLEGRVEPDEAPPGLQEVATLVLAARSLHANGGLAGENSVRESAVVAAFVKSVRPPQPTAAPVSPRPRRSAGRFSTKVAGTAAVLVLGGAAAAAATGSLPGSVQAAVSRNLSHLGINVPNAATHAGDSAGAGSNVGHGRSTALAAPTTTANEFGLCTAYSHVSANATSGNALSSVAFSRLAAAATANGFTSVQAFCASIPNPGTSTGTSSDGTSSTDNGGKPATTPSGQTPGPPATTPAGNTPGSSSSNPSGDTSGPPATTPAGNTPGSPPATNPGGSSGSRGTHEPVTNGGNSSTTPGGTAPGLTQTGAG